jgi:hypothetical protein
LLLLAGNGCGLGAQKLLRGLYERAVTAAHLIQHLDEVEAYLNYHRVAQHKLLSAIMLVAVFMTASVALFYMPGQDPPLQQHGVPAVHSD